MIGLCLPSWARNSGVSEKSKDDAREEELDALHLGRGK